jgi:hypothetical protein
MKNEPRKTDKDDNQPPLLVTSSISTVVGFFFGWVQQWWLIAIFVGFLRFILHIGHKIVSSKYILLLVVVVQETDDFLDLISCRRSI